jgi:hypothetical protein
VAKRKVRNGSGAGIASLRGSRPDSGQASATMPSSSRTIGPPVAETAPPLERPNTASSQSRASRSAVAE